MMKLLSILVLIGLSIGISFAYTKPMLAQAQATKQKVARIQEALDQARHIRTIRDKLLRRYRSFDERNIERLNKMIPDHVDNIKLVLDMDGIAAQFGLRLSNVQIQSDSQATTGSTAAPGSGGALRLETEESKAKKALSIGFTVEAQYDEFLAFLRDLERSLRIVDIEKLVITPLTSGRTELGTFAGAGALQAQLPQRYRFSLVLRTYWLNKEYDGNN